MPVLATESDWLDQTLQFLGWLVGSSVYWLLEKALFGLIYLFDFGAHHWVLTLIAAALLLVRWIKRWQLANLILLKHAVYVRLTQVRDQWRMKRARAKEASEKRRLRGARPRDFEARIAGLQRKRDEHGRHSSVLLNAAAETSDNEAAILRAEAERHRQIADRLQHEIDHLEALWESRAIADLHDHARRLVDQLIRGGERDAKRALGELNTIWRKVEWGSFLPYDVMTSADQDRAVQLLQMMASNAHVGEARNAFAFLERILSSYHSSWRKAA